MTPTRKLTTEEHDQGWYPLTCGEHAYVFRSEVAARIPPKLLDYCPQCDVVAVRIKDLKRLLNSADN